METPYKQKDYEMGEIGEIEMGSYTPDGMISKG